MQTGQALATMYNVAFVAIKYKLHMIVQYSLPSSLIKTFFRKKNYNSVNLKRNNRGKRNSEVRLSRAMKCD
jgi:hypothetical protein